MYLQNFLKTTLTLSMFVFVLGANSQGFSQNVETEEKPEVYFDATYENFSKTYWRYRKFDIEDKLAINNYMKINECDLYTEYSHNEFEWSTIQKATTEFLELNKKKFPENYRFVQPISLGEYDFEKQGFNIAEEYAMRGVNRLEIPSDKLGVPVCGDKNPVEGYPKVIALELTRPLVFDFFKVEPGLAKEILTEKMEEYEKLSVINKTRQTYLESREVYMVAKVKMFAYKPDDELTRDGYYLAKMLGILEEINVYADKNMTQLIYKKDLRRKKRVKKKDF